MDDYPLLNLFLTMLWFFLFIAWVWVLFMIFADIIRNRGMSGWKKALWTLLIIVLPLVGVLIYLIVHGSGMTQRTAESERQREEAFKGYIRQTASEGGQSSVADELGKLAELRDAGTITVEEFQAHKAKLLA